MVKKTSWLEGKKTYIGAGILALTALYQIWTTGTIDTNAIQVLAASLGIAGLRLAK